MGTQPIWMQHDMSPKEPYKSNNQQQQYDSHGHNIKGYFNDPDKSHPGTHFQIYNTAEKTTPRHRQIPFKQVPGKTEVPKRHFCRSDDGTWKSQEEVRREQEIKHAEQQDLLQHYRLKTEEAALAREELRARERQQKIPIYDPFSHAPWDGSRSHPFPKSLVKETMGHNMEELPGFQRTHDDPGNVAIRLDKRDNGLHRYEMRPEREKQIAEVHQSHAAVRADLSGQIQAKKSQYEKDREESAKREHVPITENLDNCVNPKRSPDGSVHARRYVAVTEQKRAKAPDDFINALQTQAAQDAERRNKERAKFREQSGEWDPFEGQNPSNARHLNMVSDGGPRDPHAHDCIDGVSLVNIMSPNDYEAKVKLRKSPFVAHEEYRQQQEAPWGLPGNGAPLRTSSGSTKTGKPPNIMSEFTGTLEDSRQPRHVQMKMGRRQEQQNMIRQREEALNAEQRLEQEIQARAWKEQQERLEMQKAERERLGRPPPREHRLTKSGAEREQQKREYAAYLLQQTEQQKRQNRYYY
eukprot:m.6673 g.6673  ORF g.6673 m.6673 type:complete len:524 (+) comp3567_c0_seq1:197-1768(+)